MYFGLLLLLTNDTPFSEKLRNLVFSVCSKDLRDPLMRLTEAESNTLSFSDVRNDAKDLIYFFYQGISNQRCEQLNVQDALYNKCCEKLRTGSGAEVTAREINHILKEVYGHSDPKAAVYSFSGKRLSLKQDLAHNPLNPPQPKKRQAEGPQPKVKLTRGRDDGFYKGRGRGDGFYKGRGDGHFQGRGGRSGGGRGPSPEYENRTNHYRGNNQFNPLSEDDSTSQKSHVSPMATRHQFDGWSPPQGRGAPRRHNSWGSSDGWMQGDWSPGGPGSYTDPRPIPPPNWSVPPSNWRGRGRGRDGPGDQSEGRSPDMFNNRR